MKIIDNGSGLIMRGWTRAESDFIFTSDSVDTTISGTFDGTETIKDAVFYRNTSATTDTNYQLQTAGGIVSFTSLDPSIATVDVNGYCQRITNGVAGILAKSDKITKRVDIVVSRTTGVTVQNYWKNWLSGSLAQYLNDHISALISGKDVSAKPLFSVMDHTTPNYVRNTNCWTGSVNVTPFSVWNNDRAGIQAQWQHGSLVHPQIFILVSHYAPTMHVGKTLRWITMDNQIVERTLTTLTRPDPIAPDPSVDMYVCKLNAPVPNSISYCKVLPSNWQNYLPSIPSSIDQKIRVAIDQSLTVPVFYSDQFKSALIGGIYRYYSYSGITLGSSMAPGSSTFEKATVIGGDSGSPIGLIIGNEIVLLSMISGASTTWNKTSINSIMNSYVPGAHLTEIDLSAYSTY